MLKTYKVKILFILTDFSRLKEKYIKKSINNFAKLLMKSQFPYFRLILIVYNDRILGIFLRVDRLVHKWKHCV